MTSLSSLKNDYGTNYGSLVQAMKEKTARLDETLETKSTQLQQLITQIAICFSNFQTMQPLLRSHAVCEKYHIDLAALKIQIQEEKSFPKDLEDFLHNEITTATQYLTRPPIGKDIRKLNVLNYPTRGILRNEEELKVSVAWLKTWHDRLRSRFHFFETSCCKADQIFSKALQLDPQKEPSPSVWWLDFLWTSNATKESTPLPTEPNVANQRELLDRAKNSLELLPSSSLLFESQEAEECIQILSEEKKYAQEALDPLSSETSIISFKEREDLTNNDPQKGEEGLPSSQNNTKMEPLSQSVPHPETLLCEIGDELWRNLQFFPLNFSLYSEINKKSLEQIQKLEQNIESLHKENTHDNACALEKICIDSLPNYHECASQIKPLQKLLGNFYALLREAHSCRISQETKETLLGLRFPLKPLEEFEILTKEALDSASKLSDLWGSITTTRAQFQQTLNNGIYYTKKKRGETHLLEGFTSSISLNYPYLQMAYKNYRVQLKGEEQVAIEDALTAAEDFRHFFNGF